MMRFFCAAVMSAAVGAMTYAGTAPAAEGIGNVDLVQVWAYGTPPGSGRDAIFRGHAVVASETIETVRNGFVHVTFVDGTTLALGESTVLVLDDFVYDPNASDSMVAEFASGVFHLVSGAIDEENVVLQTPALAIGLRGTEIVVRVDDNGTTDLAVLGGSATARPTAGGDMVIVNAGQTATGSPGDTTIVIVNGLPGFATSGLPSATSGRRNLGGASSDDHGFGGGMSSGSSSASDPDPTGQQ
jgi:FecR protein